MFLQKNKNSEKKLLKGSTFLWRDTEVCPTSPLDHSNTLPPKNVGYVL